MSLAKKIEELELKKKELINIRKEQIFAILEKTGSLDIDDLTLAGALLLIKGSGKESNDNKLILECKEEAKKHKIKIPSRITKNKK